jgi:hypothetical protein
MALISLVVNLVNIAGGFALGYYVKGRVDKVLCHPPTCDFARFRDGVLSSQCTGAGTSKEEEEEYPWTHAFHPP